MKLTNFAVIFCINFTETELELLPKNKKIKKLLKASLDIDSIEIIEDCIDGILVKCNVTRQKEVKLFVTNILKDLLKKRQEKRNLKSKEKEIK